MQSGARFNRPTVRAASLAVTLCAAMWWTVQAGAQPVQRAQIGFVPLQEDIQDASPQDQAGDSGSGRYLGGAPLKTDPDLVAVLNNAERLKNDGNYRVAAKLWQAVLEQSGDTLYTDDGETYFSLTQQVESILAALPEDGLRAYRISADASAKELLAAGQHERDVDALSRVVKGFFLSSLGDDAAFRLGCIFMDRFDFVGAIRLFRKITDNYPQPDVPLDQVWLRLAVAYWYVGDMNQALQALQEAQRINSVGGPLFLSVRQLLEEQPPAQRHSGPQEQWTMRLGNSQRYGVMPSLPAGYLDTDLVARWQYYFPLESAYTNKNYHGAVLSGLGAYDQSVADTIKSNEEAMIAQWTLHQWRPSGELLLADQSVVFKSAADVTVWDRQVQDQVRWRSVWLNQFVVDDATRIWNQMQMYRSRPGDVDRSVPDDDREVQLFGDKIQQSMSIYRGVLYSIEGPAYDKSARQNTQQPNFHWGTVPRRTRTNFLAAYDLDSGKVLWRVPELKKFASPQSEGNEPDASGSEEDALADIGFMAAPVGIGDLLLAPVNSGGAIWVYALDSSAEGQLVWRSYLCDEPSGGTDPWSPIQLTIDGSTAYVSAGSGVLFALDPMTGEIRFARRYERTGEPNQFFQQFGTGAEHLSLDGWSEDLVIPYGNLLLLFASDYNVVWAIDRQSGKFVWKTDNRPFGYKFDYLIGVYNDMVYLGGPDSIAAISISAEGRWEWVEQFDNEHSYGRAMLTPDGLYVPIESSIARYSLHGERGFGKQLRRVGVRLGTNAPVGNLFSDGEKIWVVGGNRLYVLGSALPAAPTPTSVPAWLTAPGNDAGRDQAALGAENRQE